MGQSTYVTVEDLRAAQADEIEAGLMSDLDAADRQFEACETLARIAAAQCPENAGQAIEQLRIARWLLALADDSRLRDALGEALALIEAGGLSGEALHAVRRAGSFPCDDPLAEKALRSFWRGARVQGVEADHREAAAGLTAD